MTQPNTARQAVLKATTCYLWMNGSTDPIRLKATKKQLLEALTHDGQFTLFYYPSTRVAMLWQKDGEKDDELHIVNPLYE